MSDTSAATRIAVRKTYKLYIGGAFPRSESGRSYLVTDHKGGFAANAALASRKDARDAVSAARKAFGGWSALSYSERGEVLHACAEALAAHVDELVPILLSHGATVLARQAHGHAPSRPKPDPLSGARQPGGGSDALCIQRVALDGGARGELEAPREEGDTAAPGDREKAERPALARMPWQVGSPGRPEAPRDLEPEPPRTNTHADLSPEPQSGQGPLSRDEGRCDGHEMRGLAPAPAPVPAPDGGRLQ